MWRSELAKARDRVVILEAAVVRAEEKVRVTEADAEAKLKEAVHKESVALKDKEDLLAYVTKLQAQLQRFGSYSCWAIYEIILRNYLSINFSKCFFFPQLGHLVHHLWADIQPTFSCSFIN